MTRVQRSVNRLAVTVLLFATSCGPKQPECAAMPPKTAVTSLKAPVQPPALRPATSKDQPSSAAINSDADAVERGAAASRAKWQGKTFEEFEQSVFKEPGANGKYIVSGDIAIADRKHLKEFFDDHVASPVPAAHGPGELILMTVHGKDATWTNGEKMHITYCVSTAFGARHQQVVQAIKDATSAWSGVAQVEFVYVPSEDATCTASNTNVLFDVNPVDVHGEYLARAFFPNEPRQYRNVLIDQTSFALDPNGKLQLVGILRHELGHALGLRHEHTRPESGACFEDNDWRPLTSYDRFSVMHYPQCNGGGDWTLQLTDKDRSGIACIYGEAPGFHIDYAQVDQAVCQASSPPPPPGPTGPAKTQMFAAQNVPGSQEKLYAAFPVAPGTNFRATMKGSGKCPGDPDLYVSFAEPPQRGLGAYACRPFLTGADETCTVDVPAGASTAYVMVYGNTIGTYDLTVTYTPSL